MKRLPLRYLACEQELGLDRDKVNVYGSGIALGHPVGASGCRLLVTLFHGMISNDLNLGIASLCAGGGMGFALVLGAFVGMEFNVRTT